MYKTGFIALLIVLFAVPSQASDRKLLYQIYKQVPEVYVEPLSVEDMAVSLLKGLNAADKKLRVGDDSGRISLYYNGKLVKSLYKPDNRQSLTKWIDLSDELIDLAVEKSRLAAKHDFEIIDIMLAQAVTSLDEDSKFYANPEAAKGERRRHQRNFTARMEGDSLYVKILAFNTYTYSSLKEALEKNPDAEGLILDLRGSPGGLLEEAVKIADMFLDDAIIVSTLGKRQEDNEYYNAGAGDFWEGKPITVLVDGETASAAEVLAAALQDQGRAKLVGTLTYGKGSIQKLIRLGDGATLAVTNAYYYTPSGFKIQGKGIIPNICTFEMPTAKNIDNLLSLAEFQTCGREKRASAGLDLETAKRLNENRAADIGKKAVKLH